MKKVKAVDIARKLGISKATVSLALNNRPGVSEQTKRNILECKRRMESGELPEDEKGKEEPAFRQTDKQIKVLLISKGKKNVQGAEMDLWTDVNAVFERYARKQGYTLAVMYLNFSAGDLAVMVEECNSEKVAGVIVLATELDAADTEPFAQIYKPLVMYDCDIQSDCYPTVLINNRQGIELAIEELVSKGNTDIVYLANSLDIDNYLSRRNGYEKALKDYQGIVSRPRIIKTGSSVEEVYQTIKHFLQNESLPHAFIMESYHVSIGTIRALQDKNIAVPKGVSLIGVDVLPEYLTGGYKMTAIRIPHTERAYWVMQMLLKEIGDPADVKSRLYVNCELIPGETVFDRRWKISPIDTKKV